MKKLLRTLITAVTLAGLSSLSAHASESIPAPADQAGVLLALFDLSHDGGLHGGDYGV